jgi:aryl-alcohol dehydrogenase-like predicted oxidoreductase
MRDSRKEAIFREVDASLARLKTDRIDLYQLHWPDPVSPLDETAEALSLLLQAGKIGAVGISNCTLDELKALRARVPISAVQSPFNLFERGIEGELVPFCKENKIPVLGYGALCRGLLSGAMSAGAAFRGDDLRTFDPKYKEPLYSQYLACANELSEWVKRKHRRTLLELSIRWAIDKGAIPLWGPRNRSQLIDPKAIDGWKLKSGDLQEIDAILARRIAEPLGVEFLTPPCRDSA